MNKGSFLREGESGDGTSQELGRAGKHEGWEAPAPRNTGSEEHWRQETLALEL
jgi:hypothetical protein